MKYYYQELKEKQYYITRSEYKELKLYLNDLERIPFRSSADLMDEGIPPFSGDKQVEFRGNYETDGFIFVRQTQPLPFTILSLYPRLATNDG